MNCLKSPDPPTIYTLSFVTAGVGSDFPHVLNIVSAHGRAELEIAGL